VAGNRRWQPPAAVTVVTVVAVLDWNPHKYQIKSEFLGKKLEFSLSYTCVFNKY